MTNSVKNRERAISRPTLSKRGVSLVEKTKQLKNIAKSEGVIFFFQLPIEKQEFYLNKLK